MTKDEMSKDVQHWLGLQEITDYDETTLVDRLLHQGAIDLLARTRCVVRCLDLHVHAGVEEYTLDHAVLSLVDVENGATRRARRDQTNYSPSFALIRSDILRVQPVPDVDGDLQTWAVMRPQMMTASTDSPGMEAFGAIPDEFQDAIVTYALWKGADYADDQSSQVGERYRILYEGQDGRGGRLAQIRSAVNKRGTARAPARRVSMKPVLSRSVWTG